MYGKKKYNQPLIITMYRNSLKGWKKKYSSILTDKQKAPSPYQTWEFLWLAHDSKGAQDENFR